MPKQHEAATKTQRFDYYGDAREAMCRKNRGYLRAENHRDLAVVVEGPDSDWFVMDIREAIKGDFTYEWAF